MRIRTHTNPLACNKRFDLLKPLEVFPNFCGYLDFEIGFGQSSFIKNYALANPNRLIIGIDVRKKVFDTMVEGMSTENIPNVLLVHGDGKLCLHDMFADASIDNIFIFHPDPWLKIRHHKRRLVTNDFLLIAQRKLKPGGKIHISTDVYSLWESIIQTFASNTRFTMIPSEEFWTNYSTRWHEISQEKGRQTYCGTFLLKGNDSR